MEDSRSGVLVVDDEPVVRTVCERILRGMGLNVETAANGEEALARLKNGPWDCVLTDISMPGPVNGVALTEEIKHLYPSTDVVIMTGNPSVETAVSTLKYGASDYLTKPMKANALRSVVRRCLEKRRLSPDLNRENQLLLELSAAYTELQKVERLKNAFISTLGHELRTPLTIAISAAELLRDGCADPRRTKEIADVLRSSLAREKEVVEDLLLFSHLASGGTKAKSAEIDLREMIRALVENYKSIWEEKQLVVEMSFPDTLRPFHGDAALLKTAFKHLLLNAIQFNKKEGRVQLRIDDQPGNLHVLFTDTGIGIAQDQQALIFDRFYQVAEHMTRLVGGLGLGLAIVRRAVEAHGGSISISSQKEVGSTFKVTLPK
jgi:hypothetical protein